VACNWRAKLEKIVDTRGASRIEVKDPATSRTNADGNEGFGQS
jgi:hypothetical protein